MRAGDESEADATKRPRPRRSPARAMLEAPMDVSTGGHQEFWGELVQAFSADRPVIGRSERCDGTNAATERRSDRTSRRTGGGGGGTRRRGRGGKERRVGDWEKRSGARGVGRRVTDKRRARRALLRDGVEHHQRAGNAETARRRGWREVDGGSEERRRRRRRRGRWR